MNWNNVKLIFQREMRDQLRDRRTLFLIAVLPLLLYPLIGMSFFQMTQFLRKQAAKVLVIGADELQDVDWLPQLLDGRRFDAGLFDSSGGGRDNLQLIFPGDLIDESAEGSGATGSMTLEKAQGQLASGEVQVVLYFPPAFASCMQEIQERQVDRVEQPSASQGPGELPQPQLLHNSANETSQVAHMRVERIIRHWRSKVTQKNLQMHDIPLDVVQPFHLQVQDVAVERQRATAVWSKILPFVLFVWALTGAFYPAVDLCAGEKERGTLETLLASPAQRREIVWGKLLTVMLFSITTALLNLASMGLTGRFVLSQLQGISGLSDGPMTMPPMITILWLVLGLLPISAMFSALCLALAALARSTKEGQYYLMPLVLVTLPLMLLPMAPGVELNLGNSLIPVTGVVLLLRSMIEGQYAQVMPYILPVAVVTLGCCLLAIRWAEEQFNRESVLFRESERLDLGRWLAHLVRDRSDTPTAAQAVFCLVTILIVQFFISLALSARGTSGLDFPFLVQTLFISQVVCIFLPPAMMALLFLRRRMKSLLLDRMPALSHMLAALGLAILAHPLGVQMSEWIQQLYPFSPEVSAQVEAFSKAMGQAPNWWIPLLLIALLPAICEEIAFRGFILSGLRHLGHKWWAIVGTSIAFGGVHLFLQQKISAAVVGMLLGILAVQTASLIPCIIFHAVYNGLGLLTGYLAELLNDGQPHPVLQAIMHADEHSVNYQVWFLAICATGVTLIVVWLLRVPYESSDEEQLQEARDHQGRTIPHELSDSPSPLGITR
ncbi:MAG: ABC transporter permease subunit/CPBP intramembrane protease [Pirellulales bacterium]